MKNFIQNIIDNILKSLNTSDEGFSFKKLLALIFSLVVVGVELKWAWKTTNFDHLLEILLADFGLIGTLLGIGAVQSMQRTSIQGQPAVTATTTTTVASDAVTQQTKVVEKADKPVEEKD